MANWLEHIDGKTKITARPGLNVLGKSVAYAPINNFI
jgi:hypothetical protein